MGRGFESLWAHQMKIEIINLYKNDYKAAYIVNNKDGRKRVILYGYNGSRKGMLYARYIWEDAHNMQVPKGYEIDHINNDKTDDRLENLQILSKADNIRKSHPKKNLIELVCPICGKPFMFEARNISTHPNPCCSKKCGYIKKSKIRKK